jgi:hypothetical protein
MGRPALGSRYLILAKVARTTIGEGGTVTLTKTKTVCTPAPKRASALSEFTNRTGLHRGPSMTAAHPGGETATDRRIVAHHHG